MKKIIMFLVFTLIMVTFYSSSYVNSEPLLNINYGQPKNGYEIIKNDCIYTKGSRTPLFIGGTDTNEYYTYYLYSKLRINTLGLTDPTFKKVENNKLIGSFEEARYYKRNYITRTNIGFEIIDGASINLALESYKSTEYEYAEGEEIEFYVNNTSCNYYTVAVITIELKLVEHYVLEEIKYGGFTGNVEKERITHRAVENEYYFSIDYDLIPICFDDLSPSEKNKYQFKNDEYSLNLSASEIQNGYTFVPNMNDKYYEFIDGELKNYYYA